MEKNRRKDMGIGKMAGEAAIEVMKNENVQNKTESVIGMLFPYAGVTKKAVDMYIDEIEKADMSPEAKAFSILNIKKTIKGIKNQKAIADIAMENAKKGTDFSAASGVSEEWVERFMDSARFVSTENIQIIWGKILANEFETPGSTPPNMIRILSELTSDLARTFRKICSMKVWICLISEQGKVIEEFSQNIIPYECNKDQLRKIGISLNVLNELETLGVIRHDVVGGYITRGITDERVFIYVNGELGLVTKHKEGSIPIGNVVLTAAGIALQKIIDDEEIPEYPDMIKKYLQNRGCKFTKNHNFIATMGENNIIITEKSNNN